MSEPDDNGSLLPTITGALVGIPHALIPASVKALDRLIGAGIDLPIAWLAQKKAQIDSQTRSYTAVEKSVSQHVAAQITSDPEILERASPSYS